MVRILKWFAAMAGVLLLLVVGVYLVSRAMGPSKVEKEAVATVDAPPIHEGLDGFADLYTITRDVPKDRRSALLAEDVRRMSASPAQPATGSGEPVWRSALEEWPELGVIRSDDPDWCNLREPGCLGRVRAGLPAYAGLIERNAAQLDRVSALSAWDHFANPFPPRLDTPLPAYQPLTRLITRDAWRFASGDIAAGLSGVCSGIGFGRKMVEAGDSLIGSMIGAALVRGNATLLAEMLAELPREHILPPTCEAAVALPMPLDNGVCRTMLSEARFMAGGLRTQVAADVAGAIVDSELPAWSSRIMFDPERTVARMAPKFSWYCSDEAHALLKQDKPLIDRSQPPSRWSMQCASNAVGCILEEVARPAYADYGLRLQDAEARLRTAAALLWLREQPGVMDEAMLARLPPSMQSPTRPLRLDAVVGTLTTALYEKPGVDNNGNDGIWAVPLPASRLQPAEVTSP